MSITNLELAKQVTEAVWRPGEERYGVRVESRLALVQKVEDSLHDVFDPGEAGLRYNYRRLAKAAEGAKVKLWKSRFTGEVLEMLLIKEGGEWGVRKETYHHK